MAHFTELRRAQAVLIIVMIATAFHKGLLGELAKKGASRGNSPVRGGIANQLMANI